MIKLLFLFWLLLCQLPGYAQFTTTKTVLFSEAVGDSFDIYISVPLYDTALKYNLVYYLDANIRSGNTIRKMIDLPTYAGKITNTAFIGIGHRYKGNHNVPRKRDFVFEKDSRGTGGKASRFLQFLQAELTPMVAARFKHQSHSSIIGHSLGGLFVFYCLFCNPVLFDDYYALSPALWVQHRSVFQYSKHLSGFHSRKYLFFSAGTREVFNKILAGTNFASGYFKHKKLANFSFTYQLIKRKSHHTQVPVSLQLILEKLQ